MSELETRRPFQEYMTPCPVQRAPQLTQNKLALEGRYTLLRSLPETIAVVLALSFGVLHPIVATPGVQRKP